MALFKPPAPPSADFVRPEGRKLFFFLIRENFWSLICLNMLAVLLCIPIVTAPIAMVLCTEYCLRLQEDRPVGMRLCLRIAFRTHGKPALCYGLFGLLLPAILLGLCDVYSLETSLRWQTAACLVAVLFIHMTGMYAYPMLCRVELPVRTVVSNALRLLSIGVFKCLACTALQAVLWIAGFLLFPSGLTLILIFGLVPPIYLSTFLCYKDIQNLVIK